MFTINTIVKPLPTADKEQHLPNGSYGTQTKTYEYEEQEVK